jgi:uncharacterized protein (TIGR03435 family)
VTRFASLLAFSALTLGAQTFDVASIKPAAPPDASGRMRIMMGGGPGTDDPGRITYSGVPLKMILTLAFNVKAYQITGPDWLDSERFDVTAKVPPGTTKEQARVMMQNLLADRFKLTIHHETKEMAAFILSAGKNGAKLKASEPEPAKDPDAESPRPAPGPMGKLPMGKDGFPEFPKTPGRPAHNMMRMNGQAKIACEQCSMAEFLDMLGMQVEKPVVDMTGLKGTYDFSLIFQLELRGGMMGRGPMPPGAGGPPPDSLEESQPALTTAVQEQLGLKLDSKKAPVDLIVIDHVEKTPSEN